MCNAYNHPPGCTCGWGGDGHAGRSYGGWTPQVFSPPTPQYRSEWKEQEFTRPTDCPICGADVFFIRHNGGCVWVDELGWPWPKHACFDTPSEPTTQFSQWTAKSSRLTNPLLGIVLGFRVQPTQSEPRLVIRLTDSSRVSLILRWTPAEHVLLGALSFSRSKIACCCTNKRVKLRFTALFENSKSRLNQTRSEERPSRRKSIKQSYRLRRKHG